MAWFRVDDTLPFHARVIDAGNPAMGLWVRAGAWSMQQLTDGFIPSHVAKTMGSAAEIKRLVSSGLWIHKEGGYEFHKWDSRQPSKEKVLAERDAATERQRRAREAAKSRRESQRDNRVSNGPPDPTRPDPKESTYVLEAAHESNATPRKPPRKPEPRTDPAGWKLVRDVIPTDHPNAVMTELAIQAAALLSEGHDRELVRSSLLLWNTKPLGPKALPSLLSEVKKGQLPAKTRQSTTDQRVADTLALAAKYESGELT